MYKKLKHFQFCSHIFSGLEHTGTPLAAKSKNREDLGSEGREKAVAGIAQESDRAPHIPVPEEQTHVKRTHCSTDRPVTYWELEPGNKVPNCWHSKCHSRPR